MLAGPYWNCVVIAPRFRSVLAALLILGALGGSPAYGQAGTLDPSFGTGGVVDLSIGRTAVQYATASVTLPDGRTVVAGYTGSGWSLEGDFALVRLLPDGSPDPSFGTGGSAVVDFGGKDAAYSLALTPDGGIVVAGQTTDSNPSGYAVARLTADGVLDPSFSGDGRLIGTFGPNLTYSRANGVAVLPGGEILVAGTTDSDVFSDRSDVAIAKLRPDGTPDAMFGVNGLVVLAVSGSTEIAYAIAVQPDGRIVLAGSSDDGLGLNSLVHRLTPTGAPDATFSGDGRVIVDFGNDDWARAVAIHPDGRIVIGGSASVPGQSSHFAVAQLLPDGTLDPVFSGDGRQTLNPGNRENVVRAIALLSDGRVMLVGYSRNIWSGYRLSSIAMARLLTTGSPDTSFSTDGLHTIGLSSNYALGTGVGLVDGGDIIVTGYDSRNDDVARFGAARLTAAGAFAPTYGTDGRVVLNGQGPGDDSVAGVGVQPDGRIVVVGTAESAGGSDLFVARLLSAGTLDPSFGTGGVTTIDLGAEDEGNALLLQPDGRIVVAGTAGASPETLGEDVFAVLRLTADGHLDPTFGDSGGVVLVPLGTNFALARAFDIATTPDGAFVVAGSAYNENPGSDGYDTVLVRLTADGVLDAPFGGDGISVVNIYDQDYARSVGVQADGKIVVLSNGDRDQLEDNVILVARVTASGVLDGTFGAGGRVLLYYSGYDYGRDLAIQPDGRIVAVGQVNYDMFAMRLTADGQFDPTFSDDGRLSIAVPGGGSRANGVALEPDGDVIVAGSLSNLSGTGVVVRLTPGGELDGSFGQDGIAMQPEVPFIQAVTIQSDDRIVVAGSGSQVARLLGDPIIASESAPSDGFTLSVSPNPARGRATVRLALPSAGPLHVALFDMLGRQVATLFDGAQVAGTHEVAVETAGLSPGVYVVRAESGDGRASAVLTVAR